VSGRRMSLGILIPAISADFLQHCLRRFDSGNEGAPVNDQLAMWPPMLSTRERLTIREPAVRFVRSGSGADRILSAHVPDTDRSCSPTTYGKSAFELAVRTAGLAGGKIILPSFVSHDFVGVFHKYDITPIFVDVDLNSWHLDPMSIDPGMLDTASSLVVLHTFGLPADGRTFHDLCDRYQLVLIEDCARTFGARGEDGLVGSHGDFAVYSLSKVAPVRRGGLLVSRTPIEEA